MEDYEVVETEFINLDTSERLKHQKWQWVEHLEKKEMYPLSTYLETIDPERFAINNSIQLKFKERARTPKQRKLAEAVVEDMKNEFKKGESDKE
jgi:hypothetical protein